MRVSENQREEIKRAPIIPGPSESNKKDISGRCGPIGRETATSRRRWKHRGPENLAEGGGSVYTASWNRRAKTEIPGKLRD